MDVIGMVFGMFGCIFGMTALVEVRKLKKEVEALTLQPPAKS